MPNQTDQCSDWKVGNFENPSHMKWQCARREFRVVDASVRFFAYSKKWLWEVDVSRPWRRFWSLSLIYWSTNWSVPCLILFSLQVRVVGSFPPQSNFEGCCREVPNILINGRRPWEYTSRLSDIPPFSPKSIQWQQSRLEITRWALWIQTCFTTLSFDLILCDRRSVPWGTRFS